MRWYFPSWNGDVRIASHPDDLRQTLLTVIEPTPHELELLDVLSGVFRAKGWVKNATKLWKKSGDGQRQETVIKASLLDVGSILLGRLKPGIATLTVVTTEEGGTEAMGSSEAGFPAWIAKQMQGDVGATPAQVNFRDVDGYAKRQAEIRAQKEAEERKAKEKADRKAAEKKAADEAERKKKEAAAKKTEKKKETKNEKAATSVKRPTACCPDSVPGPISPATEVLYEFLTPEQREQWDAERRIVVCGGLTGHRYLVAHRHTQTAQRITKCCYDLDDEAIMHFHDWTVPPEEEVLAVKLILEHREPWLRNEATCLDGRFVGGVGRFRNVFKNPFGDGADGTHDAGFTHALGNLFYAIEQISKYDA